MTPVDATKGKSTLYRQYQEIDNGNYLSKRIPKPNRRYLAVQVDDIPKFYKEAENSSEWMEAIDVELKAMEEFGVWEIVQRPPGINIVKTKWIFDLKRTEHGEILRYKARLVAQGFSQVYGVDYHETYSPTLCKEALRTLLVYAVTNKMTVRHFDVKSAFLNADLEENIYINAPKGYGVLPSGSVLKLKKALYGLKQGWNAKFIEVMKTLGFVQCKSDECIFIKEKEIMAIHVDDILVICKDHSYITYLNEMNKLMVVNDLGEASYFLKIKIRIFLDEGKVELSQEQYIKDLLEETAMTDSKPMKTPLDVNTVLEIVEISEDERNQMKKKPFREIIGKLNYLATNSRPDLSIVISKLGRFSNDPALVHWKQLKRCLRYLKGTITQKLVLNAQDRVFNCFTDADWAGDVVDRKSTSGYVICIGNAPVLWKCKRQDSVATSTMESEFKALTHCLSDFIWLWNLAVEIGFHIHSAILFADNMGAITTTKNNSYKGRAKHNQIHYHFVRETIMNYNVEVKYIDGNKNPADLLTKQVTHDKLVKFKKCLNLLI